MSDVFGVGKAIEKLMDPVSELVKKLAGPAAEEVGLTLQDSVKVWRAKRQYRLFEKMNTFIADAGFEPNPIGLKTLLPALDYASVEDDENLHTIFAAMLANASDPRQRDAVLPSFPIILRELTAYDAGFLNNFYEGVFGASLGSWAPYTTPFSEFQLEQYYPQAGRPEGTSAPAVSFFVSEPLQLTLDTLERSGLIAKRYSVPNNEGPASIYHGYQITVLGKKFIKACRPPSKS